MPSLEAIENTLDAVPAKDHDPWTANMICRYAHPPRMQMRDAEKLLDFLVEQGELIVTIGPAPGLMRHYTDPRKPTEFDKALDAYVRTNTKQTKHSPDN